MTYHVEKHDDNHLILDENELIMLVIKDPVDAEYLCQLFTRGTLVLQTQKEALETS